MRIFFPLIEIFVYNGFVAFLQLVNKEIIDHFIL